MLVVLVRPLSVLLIGVTRDGFSLTRVPIFCEVDCSFGSIGNTLIGNVSFDAVPFDGLFRAPEVLYAVMDYCGRVEGKKSTF